MSLTFAALLAAASLSAAPAAPARRVAVLDFNARWAAKCGAANLTDAQEERCEALRLFADKARGGALAVLRPPAFVVMTRENTAQILKDMGGQCTEGECEVETARLLGAAIVVSGEVTYMEGSWIVSIKVHDVATAALLGTADTRGKSKLEAFDNVRAETEKMLRAAVGLDGNVPAAAAPAKPAPPPPPPPKKVDPEGLLVLVVDEEDATVLVDGKEVGTGPLDKELKLPEGSHQVVVTKEGHFTWMESVKVDTGGKTKVKPKLVEVPKATSVSAAPGSSAEPATAPEDGRFRPWHVALDLGMALVASADIVPAELRPGGIVRTELGVGYRFNRSWAVEARVGLLNMVEKGVSTPLGGFQLRLSDGFSGSALVAWAPSGNPYFSVAASLGWMNMTAGFKRQWDGSGAEQSKSALTMGAEVRGYYPITSAWFIGARAGLLLAPFEFNLVLPTESAHVKGVFILAPVQAMAGYRF